MRTSQEAGLEEALACLILSLEDFEEELVQPPPPPPLRYSPFLLQPSPSPLPSPLCQRTTPSSRPPSSLSLPKFSFSHLVQEERARAGGEERVRAGGEPAKRILLQCYISPSLGTLTTTTTSKGRSS